jgi:hypothetical protein
MEIHSGEEYPRGQPVPVLPKVYKVPEDSSPEFYQINFYNAEFQ